MRHLALAFAATLAFAAPAVAQSVTISPNADSRIVVRDRHDHGRMRHWDRGHDRVVVRKRYRDIDRTGTVCKVTTVRRTNADGDTVVRRIRRCN